jgi:hypothetical protein
MEPVQTNTLILSLIFGLLVVWTYVVFVYSMENDDRRRAWAIFNNPCLFYAWCVTSLLATGGVLSFTVAYILMSPYAVEPGRTVYYNTTWVPLTTFLAFSALFSPLLRADIRLLVLIALIGAATAAVAIAWYAFMLFGPGSVVFVLSLALAFHCSVMDLCVWWNSWYDYK